MHVTVAGKQVETGQALQTHVRDGLSVIAKKYFDHALEANVTFRRDAKGRGGAHFACDINLKAGRDLFMRGEGEGSDAHRAFDVAAEHVATRLRRYRRRVNDHARSLAEAREASEVARQYVVAVPDEEPEGEPQETMEPAPETTAEAAPVIVAEQTASIVRLSVGEAVMRLDLEQVPVLMFRDRASDTLSVVYRRPDGNIGWIDAGRS